jgi:hypothetical protein
MRRTAECVCRGISRAAAFGLPFVDGSVSGRGRAVSYAKMRKNANHYDPNAGFDAQSINESLHATDTRRNDNFYRDRANLLLKLDENGKV